MTIEIFKTDLDVFEKQAALMGVEVFRQSKPDSEFIKLSLTEPGYKELTAHTAYYLASNFQIEIRRLTLEKITSN